MRLRSQCLQISLALIVLVLTPTLVAAQVADNEKAAKEREQRQQLERKTLSLLDDVTSEAWGLKLAQNRSFIQATAADLSVPSTTHNSTIARAPREIEEKRFNDFCFLPKARLLPGTLRRCARRRSGRFLPSEPLVPG